MIQYAHIIVDLQAGDTGKGKVAHSLAKNEGYTHVIRYNGGGNAGHTFYHNNIKFVTHLIPVGVFYGIKSIIGLGCVINVDKLMNEISELEQKGISTNNLLFIDKRAHIITKDHIEEDSKDKHIGTTKTGNGPAYRDKYSRNGLRAKDVPELKNFIIDTYDELHNNNSKILFEGAQGFELDIDWGDYPYVTSSHCTVGSAILNGVPPQKVTKVYGVAKAYRTYVGNKQFETPSPIFNKIRELGGEYGATTGRLRQISWLNLDDIIMASNINGVTNIIINKLDVLKELNQFTLISDNSLINFETSLQFQNYISDKLTLHCPELNSIIFSTTPHEI